MRAVPCAVTAKPMVEARQASSSARCNRSIRRSVYANSARNVAGSAARQAGARSQATGTVPAANSAPLMSIAMDHESFMTASPFCARRGG